MKNLKSNVFVKVGIIIIMAMLLLIPATMVKQLVHEREEVHQSAINEVSMKWGNGQTISGPYIAVPYDKYITQFKNDNISKEIVKVRDWIYFLPENLTINGSIMPEKRYRGIYEVVVYDSNLKINGVFNPLDFTLADVEKNDIHYDQATLNIGITDLKGIEKQISLNWNDSIIYFNSGTTSRDIAYSGINTPILISEDNIEQYSFAMELDIKGSQYLYFIPVGKTTDINLKSDWQSPSFTGNYLPDERLLNENGFTANWNILHLNRNYPQVWKGREYSVNDSAFGTDLLLPVDNYTKSYRVARYAILFIALTFLVFFFVEVLRKVFIHPVQYLLVGLAVVMFYTLLLSFSEHITFNLSYLLAGILTLSLITGYTSAILRSKMVGGLILGILSIFYTFIFVIIQMEDFALLIGSLGVFIILGISMYFSRKIDWYNIRIGNGEN